MKKQKKWMHIIAAVVVLAAAGLLLVRPVRWGFWPEKALPERQLLSARVVEAESRAIVGGVTRRERTYTLENGDRVVFGRMTAGSYQSQYHIARTDALDGETGTVWCYDDAAGGWASVPLGELTLSATCIYIDTDNTDYYYYPPIGYRVMENNSLGDSGSKGYLTIEKSGSGWSLRLFGAQLSPGEACDYTVVAAAGQLLDFSDEAVKRLWATYCQNGEGRWCYDGYYFPAPDTYIPCGAGVRYRCVDSYLAKSMVYQASAARCAADLSLTFLDTISLQQNDAGYFPSMSGSTWLSGDYGITPGYYDTRFNSDLMLIYEKQIGLTGDFKETVSRYFDFYLSFVAEHHDETERGGYLVWDYNQSTKPVHCSLNHQLCEILVLYHFSDLLARPELAELADRMLLAVEDTCDRWIRPDGNLHYCHLPDGSYGRDDYPYLTYNDLLYLQRELEAQGEPRNAALDTLMASKLGWMQENNVTGYAS